MGNLKSKRKAVKGEFRDADYIEPGELEAHYRQVAWKNKGAKRDVWVPNGSSNSPEQHIDLKHVYQGDEADLKHSGKAFTFLYDSQYDSDIYGGEYLVDIECVSGAAQIFTDAGSNVEVYFDHIGGYIKDGFSAVSPVTQKPPRDHYFDIPEDNYNTFEIHNCFPQMTCSHNQGVAVVTRGYEVDGHEIGTPGYSPGFMDMVDLLKDAAKAITTANCGPFIFDVVKMLGLGIINDSDDPFMPVVLALSSGACARARGLDEGLTVEIGPIYGCINEDRWTTITGSGGASAKTWIQIVREDTDSRLHLTFRINTDFA